MNKVADIAVLVTADVVGHYPSILHSKDPEIPKEQLDSFDEKSIRIEDLIRMAEFIFRNYSSEFSSNVKHQISGTADGITFAPPYTCTYMDYIDNQFLKNEQILPWIWFRYIDDVFFITKASERELDGF